MFTNESASPPLRLSVRAEQLFLVLAIAGIGCFFAIRGATRLAENRSRDESNACPLVAAPGELDLGRLPEAATHERQLHITNTSNRPITVTRFHTSCDCLGITPDTEVTFRSGETKTFVLILALHANEKNAPGSVSDGYAVQPRLRAACSVEGQEAFSADWQLKAIVLPRIRLASAVLDLGVQSDRQPNFERIVNAEAAPDVDSIDVESPPNWSAQVICESGNTIGNRFQIALSSQNHRNPQEIADIVRVIPRDRDGKRSFPKELRIQGRIVSDVTSVPDALHLGRRPCGQTVTEAMQLRSLTGRQFRVRGVTSRGDDLDVGRMQSEVGKWIYAVQTRVTKTGEQEAKVEFLIEDDEGEYRVSVPVRYCGVHGA